MAVYQGRKKFLCGVVEGFYGRPWSTEQRLDLFSCISQLGMNCYLYAPKDDDKHRAIWRELYTTEEANQLSMLMRETAVRGVEFIYAIAPGLDILFSNDKDIDALKKKLEQVRDMGCQSFAILFDDIDPDLLPSDSKVFSSSAEAQVTVTNSVFYHLQQPQTFLFCPTEYCGSRAIPCVKDSPYLKHIGEHLHSNIDIMWTGPKVISKSIPISSIEEVAEVMCRPPVIWDNLHANDYDQRQLFLGPYDGRSTELIPKLNGVLTNPNCEYGANYVAIHTLAQWNKCGPKSDEDTYQVVNFYNPKEALNRALLEWMTLFHSKKRKTEDYLPAKTSSSTSKASEMEQVDYKGCGNDMVLEEVDEDNKERTSSSASSSDMDTTPSHENSLDHLHTSCNTDEDAGDKKKEKPFSMSDLKVIVDYFYLPHLHGEKGQLILEEFCWLKHNAPGSKALEKHGSGDISDNGDEQTCSGRNHSLLEDGEGRTNTKSASVTKCDFKQEGSDGELSDDSSQSDVACDNDQVIQWLDRATNFHSLCEEVNDCFNHLTAIPNRPLLYDLYQYMSDARETTMLLDSYISWLEAGGDEVDPKHKPVARREGIVGEMLKQLPQVKSAEKLHRRGKPPPTQQTKTYIIRPYRAEDKELLYLTCLETGDAGSDATANFPNYSQVLGDRYVGPYLALSSDLAFVLEDDDGVCGYVLAVLDSAQFYHDFRTVWLPQMRSKYPIVGQSEQSSPEKDMLNEIHNPTLFLPKSLHTRFPSHLHIDIRKRAQGQGNGPRMIKTILSVLKAKGSHGVHLEMAASNTRALKFYFKLGFTVLDFFDESIQDDVLILGRVL